MRVCGREWEFRRVKQQARLQNMSLSTLAFTKMEALMSPVHPGGLILL